MGSRAWPGCGSVAAAEAQVTLGPSPPRAPGSPASPSSLSCHHLGVVLQSAPDASAGLFLSSVASAGHPHGVRVPCSFGGVGSVSEQMSLRSPAEPRVCSNQWGGKRMLKGVQLPSSRGQLSACPSHTPTFWAKPRQRAQPAARNAESRRLHCRGGQGLSQNVRPLLPCRERRVGIRTPGALPAASTQKPLRTDSARTSFRLDAVPVTREERAGAPEPGWLGRQRCWGGAKHKNKSQDN